MMNLLLDYAQNADPIGSAAEDLKFDMQYAIRAAMKRRKITQRELASLMGCTPSNISQMLSDEANPQIEGLAKALATLGEDVAFASETLNGADMVAAVKRRERYTCAPDTSAQAAHINQISYFSDVAELWIGKVKSIASELGDDSEFTILKRESQTSVNFANFTRKRSSLPAHC